MKILTRSISFSFFIGSLMLASSLQAQTMPTTKPDSAFKLYASDMWDTADIKSFPTDTLDNFIKRFGKDSLVKLINIQIYYASKRMAVTNTLNPLDALQLKMVNKHFNLGLDSIVSLYKPSGQIKLYGNLEPDSIPFDTLGTSQYDVYVDFVKELNKNHVRLGFGMFGHLFTISDKLLDTIYAYTRYQLDNKDQLDMYWAFTEYTRNLPKKNALAEKYKSALFDTLYRANNISSIIMGTVHKPALLVNNYILFDESIRLLAYGLYGKDLTIKKYGADIMYLLLLMNRDSGWFRHFTYAYDTEPVTKIYAIWALAELREQLKTYEPAK